MKPSTLALLLAVAAASVLTLSSAAQRGGNQPLGGATASPYPITQGKVTRFEKITEGVYYATGAGGGNSPVIIGDRDVLVVDTNTTPASARAFLEDLKLITTKPVRYAVNTHYHYDHTDGNQVYRANNTDVIAQEYVK